MLVKADQLVQISGKLKSKNLVLVPISIYETRGILKVEVGMARGRKRHEKKEREKQRDLDRELLHESKKYVV